MRSRALALLLAMLFADRLIAQSPGDGHVAGGAYVNAYFRFSYVWPKILQPVDPSSLNLPHTASQKEFLLFSAKQGNMPYGVILIAERLHVPGPHTSGIRDGNDFLDRVMRSWDASSPGKVLDRKHLLGGNGLTFDELDYLQNDEYNSALVTQIGEFLLAFRCNSKTEAGLREMGESVLASSVVSAVARR